MTQLTEHFTLEELQCRCGCGRMEYTGLALDYLETLRRKYGKPMVVTSGYRCPEHNAEVSSTGRSGPHTVTARNNVAVDVSVYGDRAYQLIAAAFLLGWRGIGVSQKGHHESRFIHLDRIVGDGHPRPWVWSY